MGTNFYWAREHVPKDHLGDAEESIHRHIGKRAQTGNYCPQCGVPSIKCWKDMHSPLYEGCEHECCPGCGQNFTVPFYSFTWTMFEHRRRLVELAAEEAKRYRRLPPEDWTKQAERDGRIPVYSAHRVPYSATEFLAEISDDFSLIDSTPFF